MKILSLKLNNFRQFYGEQEIQFSTDPYKNITLIHAENGVGKTALLNAIKWCFYEDTTQNFRDKKALLNNYAQDNGEDKYFVEVEFEEDGKFFYCRRGFDSISKHYFKMTQDTPETGHKPIDDPELFINSIIPKDMSEYFFFQGEGVGSFTKITSGSNMKVKEAIHNILGFKIAKQAIADLNDIKKDYRKEVSSRDKDSELSKLNESISELEQAKVQKDERHEQCQKNIALYADKVQAIDDRLLNSNSAVIKQNQKIRNDLIKREAFLKEKIRAKTKDKRDLIRKFGTHVFARKLATQALDFINEEEFAGTIPAPYNENLVRQILEQHECICGAEISDGSEAFVNIKMLLANAADPDQGNRVIRARETLKAIQTKNQDAKDVLGSNQLDIAQSHNELEDVKKSLQEISLKMIDGQVDEIRNLEENRKDYERNRDTEFRLQGRLESEIEDLARNINSKQNRINQLIAQSTGMNIYQESLEILTAVEELLVTTLQTAEESSFKDLSALINKTLDKYVRQAFSARIDKNTFNIRLIDKQDRQVAESDGQQLLLSLTFISSLIELAARRKDAKGEILTPGVIAPFVIDAPFGVLDNSYKGNMAKSIPESVEQVVFLLSSSHWEGTVEENIRDRVGKEYNLVAEVNDEQGQKELSPIRIKDRNFATVRYNCPIDRTVIEEVVL